MTAGLQNLEPVAYLPPPASSSKSDAKGAGSADNKDAGTQGAFSDFHNELQQQDTGAQETSPANSKADAGKSGSGKLNSDKLRKKQDASAQEPNAASVTPVQPAEAPKQVLPLVITFAKPSDAEIDAQVDTQVDTQADADVLARVTADHGAKPEDNQVSPADRELPGPIAPGIQLAEFLQSTGQPVKTQPSAKSVLPAQTAGEKAASARPDAPNAQILTPAAPLPVQGDATKSSGQSEESQPASPAALPLPAAIPEPVAKAIQETSDPAPSSPAALAFAARLAPAPTKGDQPAPANRPPSSTQASAQASSISGSQTPVQIPVRYAATAQILPAVPVDSKQAGSKQGDASKQSDGGAKKDMAAIDRLFQADPQIDTQPNTRTDAVTPRIEVSPEAAPSSSQAAPPPTPAARLAHIMEPSIERPAAPPTSPNDIRVRVPDNNGGSTQVRFVESGGEVRVSVRTADEGLAQNLRTHLNELTQRLVDGGTSAEIWKPGPVASSQNNQSQPDHDGQGSSGQRNSGQGNSGHGTGQGSGGQSGRHDHQQDRPAWLEEMETSLHGKQA